MPVTTSTGVIALDTSTKPLLDPAPLSSFTRSFVPCGIGVLIEATIFMFSRFVNMLYFVLLSLTDDSSEPGLASVMNNGPGFPVTAIFVIGFTSTVSDCVTLLPSCPRAARGRQKESPSSNVMDVFFIREAKKVIFKVISKKYVKRVRETCRVERDNSSASKQLTAVDFRLRQVVAW